jgi:hypothetical protein
MEEEFFAAVDIRATGPVPGLFSILEIGACSVMDPNESFHRLLHPTGPFLESTSPKAPPANARVSGLEALKDFREWLKTVAGGRRPCFVGFHVAIKFAHIHHACQMAFGESLFGPTALDLAAMQFAVSGTTMLRVPTPHDVAQACGMSWDAKHSDALSVARAQAQIFRCLRRSAQVEPNEEWSC